MQVISKQIFVILLVLHGGLINLSAQDYVQNLKVNQIDKQIEVTFDLVGKYSEYQKIKSFTVSLYCSTDNGKTYQRLENATGSVGSNVLPGSHRTILYKPENAYNSLVGNYIFKVEAIPLGKDITLGIAYLRGFPFDMTNSGSNQIRLILYETGHKNHKANLILYMGYYRHIFSEDDIWNFGASTDKFNLFTAGFGMQTIKRHFAITFGGGIGKWSTLNKSTGKVENYETTGSLTLGMTVKLLDTKVFTASIPAELGGVFGMGITYIATGLCIQF